jgi:hypothetical protein
MVAEFELLFQRGGPNHSKRSEAEVGRWGGLAHVFDRSAEA